MKYFSFVPPPENAMYTPVRKNVKKYVKIMARALKLRKQYASLKLSQLRTSDF